MLRPGQPLSPAKEGRRTASPASPAFLRMVGRASAGGLGQGVTAGGTVRGPESDAAAGGHHAVARHAVAGVEAWRALKPEEFRLVVGWGWSEAGEGRGPCPSGRRLGPRLRS